MYAVFSTGGKQYRAATGDIIRVEKLEADKGATIELDQVLLVGEGESVNVGTPLVDGGKVTARVVEHGRGDKVKVIKFKRRKNYLKRMGHRQHYTMLEITGIEGAEQPKPAKAKKKAAPKKVEAKETAEARKAKTAKPKAAKPKTAKPKTAKKKTAKKAEAAGSEKAAAKATAKAETKAKAPEEGDKDEA